MIKDIQELNFPVYATLSAATVQLVDMGEKTITTQVKIDGEITPDFSKDWEVVFQGEKYIMPLRIPAGAKGNDSIKSEIDLTFQHWAIYQLKRWPFVTIQPIDSGTAIADEEVASVQLNLGDLCNLFGQVLNYYYGDAIKIDLNPEWQYNTDPTPIEINHTKVWNVLIDAFHGKYGVRWEIKAASDNSNTVKGGEHYVIRVGYPTTEVDHIFEYGFEGGLLKIERQVQSEEIRNMLKGRGGDTNIPFRYFKNTDPNNPDFRPDPDWVEELKNIYFTNLMPATFRSYIQGWKAAHISKYPGYTAVGEANAYAPWAYRKGFTDTKFHPVEFVADEITILPAAGDKQVEILPGYSPYVKKGSSLDKYGPLPDTLDNNEEIYPTIQGSGMDVAVDVEQIESDDVKESAESDAVISDIPYKGIPYSTGDHGAEQYKSGKLHPVNFHVDNGKHANIIDNTKIMLVRKRNVNRKSGWENLDATTSAQLTVDSVNVYNAVTGEEITASGIPGGDYYFVVNFTVKNLLNEPIRVTVGLDNPQLESATLKDDSWHNTFDIWVKNIWETTKLANETDSEYSERVWKPILGDRDKNTAKVVFTTGALVHEDYEFTIVDFPALDTSKSYKDADGEKHISHWRIKLAKSDAELEATGLYVPSTKKQGKAGDKFAFIGTEMTHHYTLWAEKALDDWKKDQLIEKREIIPTFVVNTDRVRLNGEGRENALIRQLSVGNSIRIKDKRFITITNENGEAVPSSPETRYLQSITYTYREPSSDDAALNPDVEIVLSNEYTTSANPVSMMQGEISALQRQVGSISNIEQIVRAVGDKLYLRKDGISDVSMSPTRFLSLLTSDDFRAGSIGGAGWGFFRDENGNWILETDRLNVRQDMTVNTLVINQAEGRGGMQIDTAAFMEVSQVVDTPNGFVCYFDQKEGSVANLFHVDDVAFCNRWTEENAQLKFYKRRVTAVDVDSITLSKTDVNGTGIPTELDNIIHFGNYTDKTRQYVKVRDVVGGGYERFIDGLDSVNAAGEEYYFVGRQSGMYNNRPRFYIGDSKGYIEWVNGELNIKGKLSILSTVGDKPINQYVNDAAQSAADAAKAELEADINALQEQVDGVIESWSYAYSPTNSNYPANGWITDGEKQAHVGDVFYNIQPAFNDDGTSNPDAGKAWRWSQGDSEHPGYHWHPIADSDAVKALQLAQMSVRDTDVLYTQSTSQTVAPALPVVNANGVITDAKGWQTTAPAWSATKYIWQTTYVRKGDGTASFSDPTCISGYNGKDGKDGTSVSINTTEVRYSTQYNSSTQPADNTFTLTSVPTLTSGQYLWSRTKVTYSNGQGTTSYSVSRIGTNGTNGKDGTSVSIKSTSVTYAKTTGTTQPTDSAFTYNSIGELNIKVGEYMWTKTEVVYSDNTTIKSYTVSRVGSDGSNGTPGAPGEDGKTTYVHYAYANSADGKTDFSTSYFDNALYVGVCTDYTQADPTTYASYEWGRFRGEDGRSIVSTVEYYAVNNSSSTAPADSAFSTTVPTTTNTNRYLWNYEKTTYSDNTFKSTDKRVIGTHGANGVDGAGISSITNYYLASSLDSGVTTSTAGWTTDATAAGAITTDEKPYLWNYEKVTYTKGNPTTTTPHIIGKRGVGVKSITEQYYLSTSRTALQGGSWSDTRPTWVAGRFYWTRSKITYTDEKVEYTSGVCVTGEAGTSVLAQYSADGTSWHVNFASNDLWMRTSSDGGATWTQAIKIVGQDGIDGSDGPWRKFQWAKNTSTTTAPTSGWQDAPITASVGEYVWMRSGMVTPPATSPATWENATRLTGDKGASGQSVFLLDVDNEVIPISCNSSGAVTGSYPSPTATVWRGSSKITSGVTFSIPEKTGITTANIGSDGVITLSGLTATNASVTVQAVVAGLTLTTVISLYKVIPGAAGSAAKVVTVNADAQVFSYTNNFTGAPTPSTINLSAKLQGVSGYQWSYKLPSQSSFTNISGATSSTYSLAYNAAIWGSGTTNKSITIRCTSGGVFDEVTIARVSSGSNGANGTNGTNGVDGEDAYTVILTNESHSFPGGTSAALAGNTSCAIIAYKGATQVTASIGTITGAPTGMSVAISNNGTKTAGFTVTVTTSLTTKSGELTVPVTVDGKSFTRKFSWSLALKGTTGSTGAAAVVYEVEPSVNAITKSMTGTLSATSVTCTVYKVTGNTARVASNDHTLKYTLLPAGTTGTLTRTNGVSTAVSVSATTTAVVFELFNGNTLLDRERVPILSDASDLEIGGVNIIRSTAFNISDWWVFTGSSAIDRGTLFFGRYSVKLNESGNTSNKYFGVRTPAVGEFFAGDEIVASAYVYATDITSFDAGANMEVDCYNSAGTRIAIIAVASAKPTQNNTWQRIVGKGKIPSETVTVQFNINIVKNGTLWVNSPKLEFGNVVTDWSPAPQDVDAQINTFDYVKEALGQSTTMDGGLILSSLIKLGMSTNEGMNVMSGLNGIVSANNELKDLAFWAGGDMIDANEDPDNPKAAAFAVRMNGTAYAARNTVRFSEDNISIGDNVIVDKRGIRLSKVVNGVEYDMLSVANVSVASIEASVSQGDRTINTTPSQKPTLTCYRIKSVVLGGSTGGIPILKPENDPTYPLVKSNVLLGGFVSMFPIHANKFPQDSRVNITVNVETGVTLSRGSYPGESVTRVESCSPTVKVEIIETGNVIFSTTQKSYFEAPETGITAVEIPVKVSFVTTKNDYVYVRATLQDDTPDDTSMFNTATPIGTDIAVSGTARLGISDCTILGNDGLISVWGRQVLMVTDDGIMMKNDTYGLAIRSDGIKKLSNGSWVAASL